MKRICSIYATVIFTLLTAAQTHAQITNGSFESGLTGWTQAGNIGTVLGGTPRVQTNTAGSFGKTATDGSRMGYLVAQNSTITGTTTAAQVSATSLASSLGTTTAALNTAAGAGSSVTVGASAIGGSGITQTITVTAGTSLLLDWNFMTSEDLILRPANSATNRYNNDFAFISINGAVTVLSRIDTIAGDSSDRSAYHYVPFGAAGGDVNGNSIATWLFESGDGTGNATQRASDYNTDTTGNAALGFGTGKYRQLGIPFPTGGTFQISLGVINVQTGNSSGSQPSALLLDNVRFVNGIIPEPGTLALLALSIPGGALLLRRRC